jgi:histidine ammonia-lyase
MLCHATPAALKLLTILENIRKIIAIEWLAACQAYDLLASEAAPAPRLRPIYAKLRHQIPFYADDRKLGDDIARAVELMDFCPERGAAGALCDQVAA